MAREYNNKRSSRSRGGASHHFILITVIFSLGYLAASFFDFETITHWVNTQVLAHHDTKKESAKPEASKQAVIPPKPKFEFYTLLANEKTSGAQPNNAATAAQSASAASTNTAATTQPQPTSTANTTTVTAASVTTAPVSNAVTAASTTTTSPQVKPNSSKVQQPATTNAMAARPASAPSGKGNYLVQVASFKARQDAEHMKGTLILKGFSVYIIPVSHPTKGNWFRVVVGPYANRGLAQQAQVNLARNERLNGMVTTGG
ncbi:Sporulation domain-containing protein [Legionella gratiana]|uniref:Sporulation domain-containing protein n=1 Tax=Legionella gratiana TaxID=45066 RepID=A0A378JFH5_9GAMM|nr:SPOR domain-containing protein [Legionella gratiana]KTD09055.1 Sporulation domain-containing protein [Legionella gratiana]STX45731.1 Sporulation domain-containing protein [Legionella gratiana]